VTAPLELSRRVAVERVTAGMAYAVAADAAECAAVAARLMIPAVASLRCGWRLQPGPAGLVEGAGLLEAAVTQDCVVTLEPFESVVREAFTVRFVLAGRESEDDDPDAPDEVVYDGVTIDLGEAAVEQLALALDPYPRKPGAQLPDIGAKDAGGAFGALAKLRDLD
jgi:hypothetical protein